MTKVWFWEDKPVESMTKEELFALVIKLLEKDKYQREADHARRMALAAKLKASRQLRDDIEALLPSREEQHSRLERLIERASKPTPA